MALIGYARVSTADQNLDGQLDALKAEGVKPRNIFKEKKSGKNIDREQLTLCLAELEEGDVLIVAKLDRLGRSMIDLVKIINDIQAKGAEFRALDKGKTMDTTTPDGRMMFGLFAVLAEYERELIVARTNVGLEAARKRGRVGGRPKVDSSHPDVVLAKDMAAKEFTIEQIQAALPSKKKDGEVVQPSRATVYRYLAM